VDLVIYGLINASKLILIALGFSLAYGVSGVANFAHGSIYILTGFAIWVFLKPWGLSYPLAIFLSFLGTALVGTIIYQVFLVRVRGMPASEIIASFSVGFGIIELLKMVGFVGAYGNPVFMRGSVELLGVSVDFQRLIGLGAAAGTMLSIYLFTHHTKIGLSMRATAQDEQAALMLGMDSDLTATISLGLGSALAALSAVILLPLGNIYPGIGYEALLYAVAVCIVGGLGSLGGTVLAGFLLAFAQVLTVRLFGGQFQMVVIFLAILLMLIFKPSGLLGRQKELEERV
jgi:branched-chain amino acid transport system permease protein